MGASVSAYWRGITDEQRESQPWFYNDSKAWGNWMAERERHPDVLKAMVILEINALRTHTTAGMKDSEVQWVSPHALAAAALWLRHLVLEKLPGTHRILETYAASGYLIEDDSGERQFAQDLLDVATIARYAARQGVKEMTLEVNW